MACVRLELLGHPMLIVSAHLQLSSCLKDLSFWQSQTPQSMVAHGPSSDSGSGTLALLLVSCMTLGKFLKFFEPQFPLL